MSELDARFPVYGFAAHKGYGTAAHMEAIRRHGVCQEHRRSFAPIKEFLEQSAAADDTATPTVGRGAVLRALGAHTPEAPSRKRQGEVSVDEGPEATPEKKRLLQKSTQARRATARG